MSGRLTGRAMAGRAFVLPGLLLVLVALGGRYTLDRAGWRDLSWVDLRLVGVAVGITVLAVDLARRPRPHPDRRPEGWLVVATLFFLYQIASGLWAPASARVGPNALDIFLMGTLTVAVVPVEAQLDLRALGKRARLADAKDAERATGYVTGGISPLGQRRSLPTVVDESALAFDSIHVSAGRRGLELELAPADLIALTGARTAAVASRP